MAIWWRKVLHPHNHVEVPGGSESMVGDSEPIPLRCTSSTNAVGHFDVLSSYRKLDATANPGVGKKNRSSDEDLKDVVPLNPMKLVPFYAAAVRMSSRDRMCDEEGAEPGERK